LNNYIQVFVYLIVF